MGKKSQCHSRILICFLAAFFVCAALFSFYNPVEAATLTNSGFEDGLTGWTTYGDVTTSTGGVYTASSNNWTISPYQTRMAVLTPSGSTPYFTATADALGLSATSRSYLTGVFPGITNTAYIYTDVVLTAGESFTMSWNYVATDYEPYNDASFCSLVNLSNPADTPTVNGYESQVSILGATVRGTGNYSTGSYGSTGWQTASFTASGAGTYRLGFAVYNLDDYILPPYLFVDKEPGTTLLNGTPFAPIPPDDDPPPPPSTTVPSVTTGTVLSITATAATVNGSVTSDGGETVSERGIVLNTAINPTTDHTKSVSGSGVGAYSAAFSGLSPGTTYHVRAYAINIKGIAYGNNVTFTTIPAAPAATDATSVLSSGFTANWYSCQGADGYRIDVATDSGFTQILTGYNNRQVATTSLAVTGLSPATQYYYRVRAYNGSGSSGNSNTVTVTTDKQNQTITFPAISDKTYGDADFTPTATASSGLTVTFVSSNPLVATIVDNKVHIVGQGQTTITASQSGDTSTYPAPDQTQVLTVNRKTLTIGGSLLADDKTYDGQVSAVIDQTALSLIGVVATDDVGLDATAVFSDKHANLGKTVTLTGATVLTGTAADNYTLSLAGAPAGTADILPRLLKLSNFTADNKTYDGTTAVSGTGFSDDRISGDSLTFTFDAVFADPRAQDGQTVLYSNIQISGGSDAANYTLAATTGSTQANIARRTLTMTLIDKSKIYGQMDPVFEVSYDGFVSGEGPETVGSIIIYRIGGETVGTYAIGVFIMDEAEHNYALAEQKGTFTITARPLTLINRQADDKIYDGTDGATASADLSGVLPGDSVELVLSEVTFDSKHAGENKPVTAVQTLTGADSGNYSLIVAAPFATATINRRDLTFSGFKAFDKTYDGSTFAGFMVAADVISGDHLDFALDGAFSDKNIGIGKTVTLNIAMLPGGDAGNYVLTTPVLTTTASIFPIDLTVSGAVVADKTYDGTAVALISGATLNGVLTGEDVALTGHTSGLFPQASIGSNLVVTGNMGLTGSDSGNYTLTSPVLNTASILPRTLTVTGAVAQDKTYDGTDLAKVTGAQLVGVVDGDDVSLVNGDQAQFAQTGAGADLQVTPQMSLAGTDAGNYTLVQPTLNNASILARTLDVRANDQQKTYGQIDPPLTVSFIGFAPGEDQSDLDGSLIVWRQTGESAGSYEIRLMSTLSSDNYTINIQYGTLTINPKVLTVSGAAAAHKTYDGSTETVISGATLNGVLAQDDGMVFLAQSDSGHFIQADAGTGIAVVTGMTLTGDRAANYTVQQPDLQADIYPRPITVTADAKNKVYGDGDPALTWQITAGSLIGTDSFSGTLTRVAGENVGPYAIQQGSLSYGDNYTITYAGADLTITVRPVTVTADAKSKVYGDSDPSLTWQITSGSLAFSDALTGDLTRVAGENVGPYAIQQGSLTLSDNYALTYVGASLTITVRPVTVTADPKSKVYGDSDPSLTFQITSGSLAFSDAFTGDLTRTAGENVGPYAIQQGSLALSDNYALTYVGSDLTITVRPITVTADAKNKVYGDSDPSLTFRITTSSLAFSDSFTGDLIRDAGENVGSYAIRQGSLALSDNYALTYVGADLTITVRLVTVTADTKSKVYGDGDPALTFQITAGSLAFSDTFTGDLFRVAGEDVGQYAINLGTLALSNNYVVDFYGAVLTITARPITVTADAKNKVYGDSDPALTFQITSGSLAFSDAFTGDLTRAAGENVGPYAIQQGSLALSDNYALTYVGADLTITVRPVTITADPKGKVYGDSDPLLTWQITSGSLAFSDALTGDLTRVAGENVGPYAIQQGSLALSDNYALTYVGSDLTITVRPITVTADPKSKIYGDGDPSLTWQITSGSLAFSDAFTGDLTRVAGENVGPYAIQQGSLSLSDNYMLTYAAADLTITARELTVKANDKFRLYGEDDPVLDVQYINFAPWDTAAIVQNLIITRLPGDTAGAYAIVPSGATAENYTVVFVNGVLTIEKRPLTITADSKSKGYGTSDPLLSYAITSGSLLAGDQLTGVLVREPGENVGTYAILQNTLTAGDQYTITFISADFIISPYAAPAANGSVRNGLDDDNDGDVSYVAESDDGFGFAYWSDGQTLFSTQQTLHNPAVDISQYQPVFWPVGPTTDMKAFDLQDDQTTEVSFLDGEVTMILPANSDPEAVLSVTRIEPGFSNGNNPELMQPLPLYYHLLRSENLIGITVRVQIDLALTGLDLTDIDLADLQLFRWNTETSTWESAHILAQGVDEATGIFWADVDDFSTYGLFSAVNDEIPQTGERTAGHAPLLVLLAGLTVILAWLRRRKVMGSTESQA